MPPRPETPGGGAAVEEVLRDPSLLRVHVQPIVDLGGAVVAGWEALARPDPSLGVGPEELFASADRIGRSVDLHLLTIQKALALRQALPRDTFLTVNIAPLALPGDVVEMLVATRDLRGLFVEVIESAWPDDPTEFLRAVGRLREVGALIGIDDVGAGYSGLTHLMVLRPDLIKLDRVLIAEIDKDPAAQALVRAVGELASALDAWVAVEGLETHDQLAAAMRLQVPLGQGYLLGRPGEPWPTAHLGPVRQRSTLQRLDDAVVSVMRSAVERVVLDVHGRPDAVRAVLPDGREWLHPATTMAPSTERADALRRALARPEPERFVPMVVTAHDGRYLGLVFVEDLVAEPVNATGQPKRPEM